MKKITAIILLTLFAWGVNAQNKGRLTFFSQNGEKFWVIINGEKVNKDAAYNVKDIAVDFEYGKVKIIFEDPKFNSIDKNVQVVDVDNNWCHVKYQITKDKKGIYQIRALDATYEVLGPKGGGTTTTTTTPTTTTTTTTPATTTTNDFIIAPNPNANTNNTTTTTNKTTTTTTNNTGTNGVTGVNVNVNPNGFNMNINVPDEGAPNMNVDFNTTGTTTNTTTTTTTTTTGGTTTNPKTNNPTPATTTTTTSKPTYVMPGYNGAIGCPWPMDQAQFSTAKNSVSAKPFEENKLTIAKQVITSNCVVVAQVKELCKCFSFEESKLEFAKYAYAYTYDIGNYYQLNDVFSFSTSVDELDEYIRAYKR